MTDPIPKLLFFLQDRSAWFPFSHLEITYQGNLYPIVLHRDQKRESYSSSFTQYGMTHQYSRDVIMYNVLNKLYVDEWVTFVASEERNEFVQYACRRSPNFVIQPEWRRYLSYLLIRIPRLYPSCYYMEFLQPKTTSGREKMKRAVAVIKRYGCTPLKDFYNEYEVTGEYPRCYSLFDDVPKFRRLWLNCGTDPIFAGMLGEVLLSEVLQNQDPVSVRIGEWGK